MSTILQPCMLANRNCQKKHCFLKLFCVARGLQNGPFCRSKSHVQIDFMPSLMPARFKKCYKNQCFLTVSRCNFTSFISMSMHLSRWATARLSPKNPKFHWFFNGFWFSGFGPKSLGWLSWQLRFVPLVVDAHCCPEIIQIPNWFCPKCDFWRLYWLQVGSKSGARVDANTIGIVEPNANLGHFFNQNFDALKGGLSGPPGAPFDPKSTPNRPPNRPQNRPSKRLSFLPQADHRTACRSSYLMFVAMVIKSNLAILLFILRLSVRCRKTRGPPVSAKRFEYINIY